MWIAAMEKVLVAEDDKPAMRLMAWALIEEGFQVAATSIADVESACREQQPDAVIINANLPDDKRRLVIAALRRAAPGAAVIDLVGADTARSGADAVLSPPYAAGELAALIRHHTRPAEPAQ
jgi:DNA-binding response OmpR family regulator